MSRSLEGKKAIVTGGSRGIGKSIVESLVAHGAHVAFSYRGDDAAANRTVEALRTAGGHVTAVKADMTRFADVDRLFKTVEDYGAPPDIVVNSAGTAVYKPTAEMTEEDFDQMFALNARGSFLVLREAARRIASGGRIIQISTGGTAMPAPAAGGYLASKAAGELLALSLSKELGRRGVTVNVVSPGLTRTDGLVLPQPAIDHMVQQTPLGRLGEPADIADVVTFLAGNDARWLTGQNIRPTGGLV